MYRRNCVNSCCKSVSWTYWVTKWSVFSSFTLKNFKLNFVFFVWYEFCTFPQTVSLFQLIWVPQRDTVLLFVKLCLVSVSIPPSWITVCRSGPWCLLEAKKYIWHWREGALKEEVVLNPLHRCKITSFYKRLTQFGFYREVWTDYTTSCWISERYSEEVPWRWTDSESKCWSACYVTLNDVEWTGCYLNFCWAKTVITVVMGFRVRKYVGLAQKRKPHFNLALLAGISYHT